MKNINYIFNYFYLKNKIIFLFILNKYTKFFKFFFISLIIFTLKKSKDI